MVDNSEFADSEAEEMERVLKKVEDVICKNSLVILEGTLLLTNKRLFFYIGREQDDSPLDETKETSFENNKDVDKLSDFQISIPLASIISARGNKRIFRPTLSVVSHNSATDQKTAFEFIQKNKPNLDEDSINEWKDVIEEESSSKVSAIRRKNSIQYNFYNTVEARILAILDDVEWTGLFQIKSELEKKFYETSDIDQIESACKKLVGQKLAEQEENGEFFRKIQMTSETNEK